MSNIVKYDPNKNPASRNLVVSVIKDIAIASGVAPITESIWASFSGFIQWIENTTHDFLSKQLEKQRITKKLTKYNHISS
jgi:hypothetical protein